MQREATEKTVENLVQWLRLGVEATGAAVVAMGVLMGLALFVRSALARRHTNFNAVRLVLARYLALALEFQLASDILSTAIAPGWDEIGKLGAIAIIRTLLNYFLGKEINEEQADQRDGFGQAEQGAGASGHSSDAETVVRPEASARGNQAASRAL